MLNPKLHYPLDCRLFTELKAHKVVHLKSTPYKNHYRHWYWSFSLARLVSGAGLVFPVPSAAVAQASTEHVEDPDRAEIQLGDAVQYFDDEGIMFGTVAGQVQQNTWLILGNNGVTSTIICNSYRNDTGLALVDNNLMAQPRASTNRVHAQTMCELEFAEGIGAEMALIQMLKKLQQSSLTLGKQRFIWCHKVIFSLCYDWAGTLRQNEVVVKVGNKEHPTEHPRNLTTELDDFFGKFATPFLRQSVNREKLLQALVYAHTKLAWIHPFQDGNGRSIRLFLELVALKWGYRLEWAMVLSGTSSKRFYHYCVGAAIRGQPGKLTTLLNKILIRL